MDKDQRFPWEGRVRHNPQIRESEDSPNNLPTPNPVPGASSSTNTSSAVPSGSFDHEDFGLFVQMYNSFRQSQPTIRQERQLASQEQSSSVRNYERDAAALNVDKNSRDSSKYGATSLHWSSGAVSKKPASPSQQTSFNVKNLSAFPKSSQDRMSSHHRSSGIESRRDFAHDNPFASAVRSTRHGAGASSMQYDFPGITNLCSTQPLTRRDSSPQRGSLSLLNDRPQMKSLAMDITSSYQRALSNAEHKRQRSPDDRTPPVMKRRAAPANSGDSDFSGDEDVRSGGAPRKDETKMSSKIKSKKGVRSPAQCIICLEKGRKDLYSTSCGHTYHKTCMVEWNKKEKKKGHPVDVCVLCKVHFTDFFKANF